MSFSGKITTISCQIDNRAIEPISKSLGFQTIGICFMLRKDSISLILAIQEVGY